MALRLAMLKITTVANRRIEAMSDNTQIVKAEENLPWTT